MIFSFCQSQDQLNLKYVSTEVYIAQPIEWRKEENGKANHRSREVWNFARYLMSELSLVRNWQREKKREKERIKHVKLKVSTLYNQIKQSGLKIFNYKVFRSGIIPETLWTTLHQSPGVVFPKKWEAVSGGLETLKKAIKSFCRQL